MTDCEHSPHDGTSSTVVSKPTRLTVKILWTNANKIAKILPTTGRGFKRYYLAISKIV